MGTKKIISMKNVRGLIDAFDLEVTIPNLLVTDYELNNGSIVLHKVMLLDENCEVVRPVNMTKLIDHLSNCNLIFK
jgi:hypothetical protein